MLTRKQKQSFLIISIRATDFNSAFNVINEK